MGCNLAVWQRGLSDCCSLCVAGPALFEIISVYGDLFETVNQLVLLLPPCLLLWSSLLITKKKEECESENRRVV